MCGWVENCKGYGDYCDSGNEGDYYWEARICTDCGTRWTEIFHRGDDELDELGDDVCPECYHLIKDNKCACGVRCSECGCILDDCTCEFCGECAEHKDNCTCPPEEDEPTVKAVVDRIEKLLESTPTLNVEAKPKPEKEEAHWSAAALFATPVDNNRVIKKGGDKAQDNSTKST